jgi:hypothetical protein
LHFHIIVTVYHHFQVFAIFLFYLDSCNILSTKFSFL